MPTHEDTSGFLPRTGNYRDLFAYQKAEVIYDMTFRFCQRFLSKGDRTIDQMIQAARSGKQNIAEGCRASRTLTEAEIKLTNVARPRTLSPSFPLPEQHAEKHLDKALSLGRTERVAVQQLGRLLG